MLGVLILAACTGSGGPKTSLVNASCEAIRGIKSYRYTISLKQQSPAFSESPSATPGAPLSGFAQALTQLFSDMQLEGAFVAPDRTQALLRFQEEELELRSIGDRSWVRIGTTWQEQASPPGPSTILTPEAVCQDVVKDLAPSLGQVNARQETVNGVETNRYHVDEANLGGLPQLLGGKSPAALPGQFAVDVWLARDGGWPVRLKVAAADTDEGGRPVSLELFMEFKDINDPSIRIDPPPVAPAQT